MFNEFDDEKIDSEELERELAEAEAELALSQAQGNWLDGYLDAMDELQMDPEEAASDRFCRWEDEEDE